MQDEGKHERTRQSSIGSNLKKSLESIEFSSVITDYDLLADIGGVDEISYLYLARHIPTGEFVALMYTDLTISSEYDFVEEIIRSVRNTKLCRHPNILPFYLTFIENERLWSVTYPVKAGTCKGILNSHYPTGFSDVVVATILKECLKAITYLHQGHLIHNDIRANNILIDQHGDVRLTGLRQMMHLSRDGEYVKSVFSLVGDSIEWAAPEMIAQASILGIIAFTSVVLSATYDEQADIYALGITAIELAFNATPFDDWPPLKATIKTDKPMPKSFYKFVQACLVKDPKHRPTIHDLASFPFLKLAKSTSYLESHVVRRVLGTPESEGVSHGSQSKLGSHEGLSQTHSTTAPDTDSGSKRSGTAPAM
eukprot:jgi/Hompol1/3573/HPOL_003292-RA